LQVAKGERAPVRERWPATAAWVAFAAVVGCVAYLALEACDLGLRPWFALSYCRAQGSNHRLAAEQDRERDLLNRLHQAQLDIARLPVCLPDPPRRPPEQRAENIAPSPTPIPSSTPAPTPTPSPTPDGRLVVPRDLSDLNGCWQSVRGDIKMYSDDAERRFIGTLRICYCISAKGRSTARYNWQDGARCTGTLGVRLSGERLLMNHGTINCVGKQGNVPPTDIVCSSKAGDDSASCDTRIHGDVPATASDGRFRRVDEEYCR
jgi:hypothetical protein